MIYRKPSLDPEPLAELHVVGDGCGIDMAQPIIELFRRDAPTRLEKLFQALEAGDSVAAERAAHGLRGSAAQIGAVRLAALGRYVEMRVSATTMKRLGRWRPTIENELTRVLTLLPGGSKALSVPPARRTRVLIADDEPHISLFLSCVLGAEGYTTREACTASGIMAEVASFSPDVLLLDWFLEDTTAPNILDRLDASNDHPAVVVLSSRAQEALRLADFDRRGVVACLPKPIGPRALVQALRDSGFGAQTC